VVILQFSQRKRNGALQGTSRAVYLAIEQTIFRMPLFPDFDPRAIGAAHGRDAHANDAVVFIWADLHELLASGDQLGEGSGLKNVRPDEIRRCREDMFSTNCDHSLYPETCLRSGYLPSKIDFTTSAGQLQKEGVLLLVHPL